MVIAKVMDTMSDVGVKMVMAVDSVIRKNVTLCFVLIHFLYYPLLNDYFFKFPNYFHTHL